MDNAAVLSPADRLADRLADPSVSASLNTLLDHADLLATLVAGLSDFVARGDTIITSLASGVAEAKAAVPSGAVDDLGTTITEARTLLSEANQVLPAVHEVLNSGMVTPEIVQLLALVSASAVEGAEAARSNGTTVHGVRALYKVTQDPEVQRGLGLIVEIAKALGRRFGTT